VEGVTRLKRLEKSNFLRRNFIIDSEVKYKLKHRRKGGSKQLSISDSAPVTLFWIKYSNKNKKFQTFFNKKSSMKNTEISIFPCVQMPHP